MRYHPGARGGIIAPTMGDAVESCVVGVSGLQAFNPAARLKGGAGGLHVIWPNGSSARLFGAYTREDVERLRAGGNRELDWFEELAAWRYLDECLDNAELGRRLGRPHAVASTTPKPRKRLRELMDDPGTVLVKATTWDNAENLPPAMLARLERLRGSRLGRQELEAELIDDVDGALWTLATLEACLVAEQPDCSRIVVGLDPSVGVGDEAEAGIVVAGHSRREGLAYVLADRTVRGSPDAWARAAVNAYYEFEADTIVAEANQGGEMVALTIRTVDPRVPVKLVHASRGKRTRAEPVAALYEQGRVKHVGAFPNLEDQMRTWVPGDASPDRVDAAVWALTELMLGAPEVKVTDYRRREEPVYRRGDLVLRGDRYVDK